MIGRLALIFLFSLARISVREVRGTITAAPGLGCEWAGGGRVAARG
jgi:hypothetical protein